MAKRDQKKKLVFVIEYRVDPEFANIERVFDELRGYGDADLVDVRLEEPNGDS